MNKRRTLRSLLGAALLVAVLVTLWRGPPSPDVQALAQGNKSPNPLVIYREVTTMQGSFGNVGIKKTPPSTGSENRPGFMHFITLLPDKKYKLEMVATGFQPQIVIGTYSGFNELARSPAGVNGTTTLEFTGPKIVNISDRTEYVVAAVATAMPPNVGKTPVKIGSYTLKVTDLGAPLTAELGKFDPYVNPKDPNDTLAGVFRIECVATGRLWHEAGLFDWKVSTRSFSDDAYTQFRLIRDGNFYRIKCEANGRYLHVGGYPQDVKDREVICTLPEKYSPPYMGGFDQLVDDTYRFAFEKQPDDSFKIRCKANNKYLNDGAFDKLISTRTPANNGTATFYLRGWKQKPITPMPEAQANLPVSYDLNWDLGAMGSRKYNSFTDAVGNQGNEGACVAFSVCSSLGTIVLRDWYVFNVAKPAAIGDIRNKYNTSLFDAKWFYGQRAFKNKEGWWIPDALDKATKVTIPFKFGQPGVPGDGKPYYGIRIKPGGWARLTNKDEMRRELSLDHPLNASFDVYDDFNKVSLATVYRGPGPNAKLRGGHAVMILGYSQFSKSYWMVQNSWGANWGDNGYFALGEGVSGIDDTMYAIRNAYLCDHCGRPLSLEEKNQVVQNILAVVAGQKPTPIVVQPPKTDGPVNQDSGFYLQAPNEAVVTRNFSGKSYYFPQVGWDKNNYEPFWFAGTAGAALKAGQQIRIKTGNTGGWKANYLSYDLLGAFNDGVYYWNASQQAKVTWVLERADGNGGAPINFGDYVRFKNVSYNQYLSRRDDDLWTQSEADCSTVFIVRPLPPA